MIDDLDEVVESDEVPTVNPDHVNPLTGGEFDDIDLTFIMTCGFCSHEDEVTVNTMENGDLTLEEKMAQAANDDGWVMRESDSQACISIACASCGETPDDELGK